MIKNTKRSHRRIVLAALSLLIAVFSILTSCTGSEETAESETVAVTASGTTAEVTEKTTAAESETAETETDAETDVETAAESEAVTSFETTTNTAHEHKFGEWKTSKAPSCTAEGQKERVCSCGAKETALIPAKGHTIVTDKAVTATCAQPGKTEGSHCSACGAVITVQETIPTIEHTAVVDDAVEATCSSVGKTTGSHCSVCGAIIEAQEMIPAKEHTAVVDEAASATCSSVGKTEGSHCSVCGAVIEAQEIIPMKDHTPVIDAAIEPTCTEPGKTEGSHCSVCGAFITTQTEIAPLGHDFIDGSCTRCGVKPKIDIVFDSKEAHEGDEISITVNLSSNPGISSLKIRVNYGDLEYRSAKILFAAEYKEEYELMTSVKNNDEKRQINLNWISPEVTVSEDGVFAVLTFAVPSGAASGTRYDLEAVIDPNDVFDSNYNNVDFCLTEGCITVIE